MDVLGTLRDFKVKLDGELAQYLDKSIADTQEKDVFVAEVLEHAKKIVLAGGKRLRPALMYYGYLAAGGQEKEKMLRASMSIELIHTFLLIHDDIIDRDEVRHGVETLEYRYERIGKHLFESSDTKHFGLSLALIAGDMVGALGNQILFESDFEPSLILKALSKLQSIVALTVVGQTRDLYIEYSQKATEEEVVKMYEYKTARYTVEGPLHLGAILGGVDNVFLERLSRYAIPLGIAFQIQDDILGIFGSEEKLGKAVGSDIQEGKLTLLVIKAFQMLPTSGKKELASLLKKRGGLTKADIERFRTLLKESGSLEYAQTLAREYISRGKNAMLEGSGVLPEAREFFLGIADYMFKREY